jgi:plastocyanin
MASSTSSNTRRRLLKVVFAGIVAVATLAVPAGTMATTLPTKTVLIQVLITDQKIIVAQYQNAISGNGTSEFLLMPGSIPRGDFLRFVIFNHGKKVHNFTAFGKKTKALKPGGKAQFNKLAKVRGTFPYRSTLDKGRAFRGTIVIA